MKTKHKILFLDIETKPALVWTWRAFKVDISPEMVEQPDGVICVGMKWLNGKQEFYSEWEHGTEEMLKQTARAIHEADLVVGINHERFDMPWLLSEFVKYGVTPPAPTTLLDLQKFWRTKMRFFSNRLAYVAPLLIGSSKTKHEGFELWLRVMKGNEAAQRKMKRYCQQDVRLTEKLYKKLRPVLTNHPYMADTKHPDCPACESSHVHVSKYRRTKTMRIQQLHCQSCGHYFDGKRQKMTP